MKICCVPECSNERKVKPIKRYHNFPLDKRLQLQWTQALKIHREPTKRWVVCGAHFKPDDYLDIDVGCLKKGCIPSENIPKLVKTPASNENFKTIQSTKTTAQNIIDTSFIKREVDDDSHETTLPKFHVSMAWQTGQIDSLILTNEIATNTIKPGVRSVGTQTSFLNLRVTYNLMSDSELKYGTGHNRSNFIIISKALGKYSPIRHNHAYVKEDVLLLTLFMIRHNMDIQMAEFIYGVPRNILSIIFNDMLNRLHCLVQRNNLFDRSFRDSRAFRYLVESIEKYRPEATTKNEPNWINESFDKN